VRSRPAARGRLPLRRRALRGLQPRDVPARLLAEPVRRSATRPRSTSACSRPDSP
jgi:hypothetical protein